MSETITIKVIQLEDFLEELNLRGIKRIYRRWEEDNPTVIYTAFDPDTRTFIEGNIVFEELQRVLDLQHHNGGYYRSDGKWDFSPARATITYSDKLHFVRCIRSCNLPKDIITLWNAARVGDMTRIVKQAQQSVVADEANTYDVKVPADVWGIVKEVELQVTEAGNALQYKITIRDWGTVFQALTQRYEEEILKLGIKVVDGSISFKGGD